MTHKEYEKHIDTIPKMFGIGYKDFLMRKLRLHLIVVLLVVVILAKKLIYKGRR